MPVKGLIHPITMEEIPFEDERVTFDEDATVRDRPAVMPWQAGFIKHVAATDVRHSTLALSATRTMGCPRQTFIEVLWDVFIDPTESCAMSRGSINHEGVSKYLDDDWWITEGNEAGRCTLTGELFGTKLTAQSDAFRRAMPKSLRVVEIVDSKFPKDFSVKWRGTEAKGDHVVQLNIGRLLLAQQPWAVDAGYDPDDVKLTIWDHALGQSEGFRALPAPHMSEEQMLDHKPAGGTWTLREIVGLYEEAREAVDGCDLTKRPGQPVSDEARKVIASMPLVGEPMFRNKKCSQYCGAQKICERLVLEEGVPG